tara:strand:- start:9110 stop:9433 length:324 start_codon:yes stop_codon:yes gene_type:complete
MVDKAKVTYKAVRKATYWANKEKSSQKDPDFQGVSYSVDTLQKYTKVVDGRKMVDYEAIPDSAKNFVSLWKNTDSNGNHVLKTTESTREGGETHTSSNNNDDNDFPF